MSIRKLLSWALLGALLIAAFSLTRSGDRSTVEAARAGVVNFGELAPVSAVTPAGNHLRFPSTSVSPAQEPVEIDGLDQSDGGGHLLPDPALGASNNHVLLAVNAALAVYEVEGAMVLGPVPATTFFDDVAACTGDLSTPSVAYDEQLRRWIVLYQQGVATTDGGFCLAVSHSDDPTEAWHVSFYQVNTAGAWLDFPQLGVGDEYLFIGGDMRDFQSEPALVGGHAWALEKSVLYAGAIPTPENVDLGATMRAPVPLALHGAADGTWPDWGAVHYLLADRMDGQHVALLRWNVATDVLTNLGDIDLGASEPLVPVPQRDGDLLDPGDGRPHDFEYRNGYGWTTMHVGCDLAGTVFDCIRWAQIDLDAGALGPAGVDSLGAENSYLFTPDMALNRCGDAIFGFNLSFTDPAIPPNPPLIMFALRPADWQPGDDITVVPVRESALPYSTANPEPHPWGRYSDMVTSPDGFIVWYVGIYGKDSGGGDPIWGTWITWAGNDTCLFTPTDYLYLPILGRP